MRRTTFLRRISNRVLAKVTARYAWGALTRERKKVELLRNAVESNIECGRLCELQLSAAERMEIGDDSAHSVTRTVTWPAYTYDAEGNMQTTDESAFDMRDQYTVTCFYATDQYLLTSYPYHCVQVRANIYEHPCAYSFPAKRCTQCKTHTGREEGSFLPGFHCVDAVKGEAARSHGRRLPKLTKQFFLGIHTSSRFCSSLVIDTVAAAPCVTCCFYYLNQGRREGCLHFTVLLTHCTRTSHQRVPSGLC